MAWSFATAKGDRARSGEARLRLRLRLRLRERLALAWSFATAKGEMARSGDSGRPSAKAATSAAMGGAPYGSAVAVASVPASVEASDSAAFCRLVLLRLRQWLLWRFFPFFFVGFRPRAAWASSEFAPTAILRDVFTTSAACCSICPSISSSAVSRSA